MRSEARSALACVAGQIFAFASEVVAAGTSCAAAVLRIGLCDCCLGQLLARSMSGGVQLASGCGTPDRRSVLGTPSLSHGMSACSGSQVGLGDGGSLLSCGCFAHHSTFLLGRQPLEGCSGTLKVLGPRSGVLALALRFDVLAPVPRPGASALKLMSDESVLEPAAPTCPTCIAPCCLEFC